MLSSSFFAREMEDPIGRNWNLDVKVQYVPSGRSDWLVTNPKISGSFF